MAHGGDWSTSPFAAQLAPAVRHHLRPLRGERPEVRRFADRAFRLMARSRFRPEDVSTPFAWALGTVIPHLLPGAWAGATPPLTLGGRHVRIDDYVEQVLGLQGPHDFLDVGCGFPPVTAVDTAERFPSCRVLAADPCFGGRLVHDEQGDYGCFGEDGRLRYFQAARHDPARWEALMCDAEATRSRFQSLFARLNSAVSSAEMADVVEQEGCRLERRPLQRYERPNLTFLRAAIPADVVPGRAFDVVRCFNVLTYFDVARRRAAVAWMADRLREGGLLLAGSNWVRSTASRYLVCRRMGGRVVAQEFALSIDNLRPLQPMQVWTLHDDDREAPAVARVVRTLRGQRAFCRDFDSAFDLLLSQRRLFERRPDRQLQAVTTRPAPETEAGLEAVERALDSQGFVERAAALLRARGLAAWRNPVGHLAVDPRVLTENAE